LEVADWKFRLDLPLILKPLYWSYQNPHMKKTNILYWIFTSLFAALMLFSAIPDVLNVPDAVAYMTALGYPPYFTPFIGVAKILGVLAILIPGYPRIREWAYAGLTFDLIGATYSQIAVGAPVGGLIFMAFALVLAFGSYFYSHRRQRVGSIDAAPASA
jgi:apolipoprotein N-acyltransferase